ncbi:MAG: MarR family transcriptional regulator [Alphaproteobacteria bacterium]|nr:MarR family transcriptional regulator [Alphaproteobacteria bacterium]
MVDMNTSGMNLLFLRDEELRQGIELLFFAYRDFTAEPDAMLAKYGFGRAHHRVIYFVGRNPGMTVGELLGILRITKQSLSRVLGQLVDQGFVAQKTGARDRRQRLLHLTEKGAELERQLSAEQRARIARAYRAAGAQAVEGFRRVMLGIIGREDDRRRFAPRTVAGAPPATATGGGTGTGGAG